MPPSCSRPPWPCPPARPELAEYIVVGRVRRAHGVRGAWAVESLSGAPDVMLASGALLFAGDREGNLAPDAVAHPLHVEDGRPMNKEWLVRVTEVTDRDVADSWRGRYLLADAATLPEADDDEIYVGDLIGMRVEVEGRGLVGHVRDVYDAPQGYILEVETATGRPLVPWNDDLVLSVDESTGTIVFAPLDGLFD
ncbi:ribosome maturation factor RimM [Gemmatimonas sp.]|uniref:ribosome maturation factor RimM n=1 Tax=Gemmatimonas sp. TaxID=1962908 RepID=UPI0022C21D21|nr:ribosome maturation factor RimM [Gemmatimonas sp.]MCZ8012093.1 ribosome maturation factor RimM [Gemmatimonas sp.]MCZ8267413.1 ribosome maturation factor RimM [Gemmatimonas sp.]